MHILVTAGNTLVPLDRVRGITNVFTGRTGARIALHAHARGHDVTLLTSHSELLPNQPAERWSLHRYQTFDDLQRLMQETIQAGRFDAVIHSAAVSDYQPAGVYAPAPGTRFRLDTGRWQSPDPEGPALIDRMAGKVKSDEPELWLRLVRTPKLIDQVRSPWGFRSVLVKFKLEVGVSEAELLDVAERSRRDSAADLMVANTWEGRESWAYLGPLEGRYQRLERAELPARLLDAVEHLHAEGHHA